MAVLAYSRCLAARTSSAVRRSFDAAWSRNCRQASSAAPTVGLRGGGLSSSTAELDAESPPTDADGEEATNVGKDQNSVASETECRRSSGRCHRGTTAGATVAAALCSDFGRRWKFDDVEAAV